MRGEVLEFSGLKRKKMKEKEEVEEEVEECFFFFHFFDREVCSLACFLSHSLTSTLFLLSSSSCHLIERICCPCSLGGWRGALAGKRSPLSTQRDH